MYCSEVWDTKLYRKGKGGRGGEERKTEKEGRERELERNKFLKIYTNKLPNRKMDRLVLAQACVGPF